MIEQDTIKLLRECDAGVKMGGSSIADVTPYVKNEEMEKLLTQCKAEHEQLNGKIQDRLHRFKDEGKEPGVMAEIMSSLGTKMKLIMHESDHTIADVMTDGCNMGVKSLNRYLNAYGAAEEYAKDIAKKLIHLEEQLAIGMRLYL